MPDVDDLFNAIQDANSHLQQIITNTDVTNTRLTDLHNGLTQIKTSVDQGMSKLAQELQTLIQLQTYANMILFHNSQQNDTMICILEHISKNTCSLLNESHTQTTLQTVMRRDLDTLLEISQTVHPEAALESERLGKLRQDLLACCPQPEPEPTCEYAQCTAPDPLPESPEGQGMGRPPR